jgi:hypothetical protein
MSVTRYVIAVFVPDVAFASDTYVTTPVAGLSVNVPSPEIVTTLSESHVVVPGVYRHVTPVPDVLRSVPVARPDVPVIVVNATVPPANTALVSGVASGAGGGVTVGVIVASSDRPSESVAWYVIAVAVPLNVGSGSNVTVPFAFTVYVPSLATVNDVALQPGTVCPVAHNLTVVAINGKDDPTVSLDVGVIV